MKKLIWGVCVGIIFLMVHCDHTPAAGPEVSGCLYVGGINSNWKYFDKDDGSEVDIRVMEKYKGIHGRRYKIVQESSPLWSKLIEKIPNSDTRFVKRNPLLITEERGSHIAGYGWEASTFLEREMHQHFQENGQDFQPSQLPSTQWVILRRLEVGNSWTVVNLNYRLTFKDGAERRVSAEVFAEIKSVENITTELGEFETLLIEYTYREDELMVTLCSVYLSDVGPARIVIGDVTADLVDYEILPHSLPHAVTSKGKLITTWAEIKTQ